MKVSFLVICFLLSGVVLFSQTIDITYRSSKTRYTLEEYIDKFVKTDNAGVIQMISDTYGKTPSFDYTLTYSDQKSIYHTCDVDSKTFLNAHGERKTLIRPSVKDKYYKDYKNNQYKAYLHFNDALYMIDNSIVPVQSWKIENEQIDILGYRCTKATLENYRGWDVTVWFTTDLPAPIGPEEYSGLPGAILRVERGAMLLTALDIEISEDNSDIEYSIQHKNEIEANWSQYINLEKEEKEFRRRATNMGQ